MFQEKHFFYLSNFLLNLILNFDFSKSHPCKVINENNHINIWLICFKMTNYFHWKIKFILSKFNIVLISRQICDFWTIKAKETSLWRSNDNLPLPIRVVISAPGQFTRVGRFSCFSIDNLYFRLKKLWTTIWNHLQESKKKRKKTTPDFFRAAILAKKNPSLVKSKK